MSAEAARAAEMLTQLTRPARLAVLAELALRGEAGVTLAESASALDLPLPRAGSPR